MFFIIIHIQQRCITCCARYEGAFWDDLAKVKPLRGVKYKTPSSLVAGFCIVSYSQHFHRKNMKKHLQETKKFVYLQRHLEEFAERMTTFMTSKVVSSLKLKQTITLEWWFCFLRQVSVGW